MTDQLAQRIVAHYEQHAAEWDRDRQNTQWNDRIWHDRFIGRLRSGAKVLDLGCGSGRPVGEHMAKQGLRVTGVDASPTMISLCRERLPAPRMDYCRYARLALSQRFDGILAWDSFFHLDHVDQRQMFPVFEHHGSGGAVLMFNTGPAHGEAIGQYRGDPLYHASLAPSEYEALLRQFGFEVMQHSANDQQAGGRTVWLCQSGEFR